jgi:hypothetical protein
MTKRNRECYTVAIFLINNLWNESLCTAASIDRFAHFVGYRFRLL